MDVIGRNLIKIRKEKVLSQERLAAKCSMSKETIYLLETGKKKNPGIRTLQKIADVLEVPVTELLKK